MNKKSDLISNYFVFHSAETQQSSGHALATKRTCISCSSNDFEPVCMENPNFADSICESNSGLCYTSTPEIDILIRGCVGDKNIGSPEKCTDSDECISCGDKDKCNNEKVRTERCFAIKYDKDNQIQLNDSLSVTCPLAPIPLGCYHLTDTKSIEKRCVSSLNKEQRKSCRTNKLCQICFGINCNADKASRKECFMCSSQIDSDCLQPTDKSSKGFCPNSETPCIVGVDNYGHTHRRCAKDPTSNAKDFPKGFRTCNDNNCNGIIFPENRLQCYRCKQSKECDELSSQNTGGLVSHACQYFKENDDCFSFIESESEFVFTSMILKIIYSFYRSQCCPWLFE